MSSAQSPQLAPGHISHVTGLGEQSVKTCQSSPVVLCGLQCVFGLERLVDMTIAKKVPQVAYATTVGIRFVNNVVGGENFIDMARWAGVQ